MKKLLTATFLLFTLVVLIPSCVKTEFDAPPTTGTALDISDADVVSIETVKALHIAGQIEELSTIEALKGKYIKGIITADDEHGNFYKSFYMEDNSAAIAILQSRTDAYPFYAQGREVAIKLEGLYMGDYRGVVQIGGFIDGAGSLQEIVNVEEHILTGTRGNDITPTVKTLTDLSTGDVSKLITLKDVEFTLVATTQTYADAVNQSTENRDVKDCNNNVIVVRTSGFADFAATDIPDGNGTITGIYSIYESGQNVTQQLLIRSPEDVNMEGPRCDGSSGGGSIDEPVTELTENFNTFENNETFVKAGWYNLAVVGSRLWNVQEFQGVRAAQFSGYGANDAVLEGWLITPQVDFQAAKKLLFKSAFSFYDHQGLELLISNDFDGVNPNNATWTTVNVTLPQNPANDWNEYISSGIVDLTQYGTVGHIAWKYTGNNTTEDTRWLVDDIEIGPNVEEDNGGGGNTDPVDEVILNLESLNYTDNSPFQEAGWTNVATVGTRLWFVNIFQDNYELRNSAYQDTAPEMESWLVTPAINFDTPKKMSFLNGHAFYEHDGLTTWYSNDFTGDPATATWTEIDINYAPSSLGNYEVVSTGDIDLSNINGIGHIAFRYNGTSSQNTTTWIIDDLRIENQ